MTGARSAPARRRLTAAVLTVGLLLTACVEAPPPLVEHDLERELEQIADLDLPAPAATSVLRQAREITVRIRTLGCREFGVGSGFVLPGGVVVTNRHVVDQPIEVTVNTWDGRTLEARVDGVAVDSDLAILRLRNASDLPVAHVRTEPVRQDEPIVVVGYPGGGPSTITTGKVVGFVRGEMLGEPADVVRIDAEIRQGNSGGPVLDQEGRVVAVVFALELDTGMGLAVPIQVLLDRLDGAQLAPPVGC